VARRNQEFQTIRSEGGLLPPDLLRRLLDPNSKLTGTRPEDYGLPQGERLTEVITQSWNRLRKHWAEFRAAAASLPATEAGTGLTNDKWSLPLLRELGFGLLPTSAGPDVGGRTYAISRFFGPVPIHLVGCGLSLDRRAAGVRGAAAANPHGLVQEFLNRSPGHLWAIVSNGLHLRVLRDNQALSRQSFLEIDLEAMFAGEVYSDYVLLWLVAHATRFLPGEGGRPETCWLEQWTQEAEEQGTRALGDLRGGVERAVQILGEGITSHPKNTALRDDLRTGQLSPSGFHGQLLRVIYRLIFLFVAEDRTLEGQSLLHPRDDSDAASSARERYAAHYSTARLRDLAGEIKGSRHGDMWRQFQLLAPVLSGGDAYRAARKQLALPALGSVLWSPDSTASLNQAELANYDFLEALRHLAFTRQGKVLRPVDYRNLGAEELGGVYESLLALTPQISADGARFFFAEFAGNERKTSGSYYTPDSLVQRLLDSALDPVVEDAVKNRSGAEAEKAILALKVCDPAVGSGHFLVGAAHRLTRHLARARALAHGESEPSPLLYQHALRDVIGHCLYGVDINPMAVELCRVSLWLEALEPGKPLSFLDHHIREGNSLLSTAPALLAAGLPDDAFTPIEGDNKKACAVLKRRNKAERKSLGPLFTEQDAEAQARLQQAAAALEGLPDDRPEDIRAKELAFRHHEQADVYREKRQLADTWCAAFMIRKYFRDPGREASASGITQGHLNDLVAGRPLPSALSTEVSSLAERYHFFQWHLEFPEVFARGGFDCMLGNPPWERVKLQQEEFFAEREPTIARARNAAARKRLIAALPASNPALAVEWSAALRKAESESGFLRLSGRYPYGGVGDVNTYAVFADLFRQCINESGAAALLLPNGLVTGFTYRAFLRQLLQSRTLASFYGFENEDKIFPDIHNETKFGILTINGSSRPVERPWFTAHLRQPADMLDPRRRYSLTADEIEAINPNTLNLPAFRWAADAAVTAAIHAAAPVLVHRHGGGHVENPWGVSLHRLFDMANDSDLFLDHADIEPHIAERRGALAVLDDGAEVYPLYEGKMLWHFDHRYGTYAGQTERQANKGVLPHVDEVSHDDPNYRVQPRYWIAADKTLAALGDDAQREWFFAWRDVGPTERSFVGCIVPATAAGHKAPFLVSTRPPREVAALSALLSSLVVDYDARQRSSGMSFFVVEQLAVLPPAAVTVECPWLGAPICRWLADRVLELSYTNVELAPFTRDIEQLTPPFRWQPQRRVLLQAEIDAAVLHLYRLTRSQTEWLIDSFTVLRKYEEHDHGEFRSKRLILEIYDAMEESMRTGQPYQTRLDPPPADRRCCHPERTIP
jgi:N-6 DNA Methylase